MKNIKWFNQVLLSKWKWRVLSKEKAILSDFLVFRYRDIKSKVLCDSFPLSSKKASIWWKDITSVGTLLSLNLN